MAIPGPPFQRPVLCSAPNASCFRRLNNDPCGARCKRKPTTNFFRASLKRAPLSHLREKQNRLQRRTSFAEACVRRLQKFQVTFF